MAKKTKASKKPQTKQQDNTNAPKQRNTKDYRVMTSILDIMELSEIKFEPQQQWRLVVKEHGINEPFTTGLLGKTGYLLLEVVKNIYAKKLDETPPIKKFDKKTKEEYFLPFWNEKIFLDEISIDEENKIVELHFSS